MRKVLLSLSVSFSMMMTACSGTSIMGDSGDATQAEPKTEVATSEPVSLNDEAALQAALAGEGDPNVTTFGPEGEQAEPIQQNAAVITSLSSGCPRVQILSDASSITYFDEEIENLDRAEMIARASLNDIRGGCEFTANGLEVDLDLLMTGVIGKTGRFEGREDLEAFMTFPYFIAVFDEAGRPYSKQILATAIRFDPLVDRTDHAEKITQTIPMTDAQNSDKYTLTVGFQLNRRQLAYNKAHNFNHARIRPVSPDTTQNASVTPVEAVAPSDAETEAEKSMAAVEQEIDAKAAELADSAAEVTNETANATEPAAGQMKPIIEDAQQ